MPHLYSINILHDIRTSKLALTRAETKFIWMSHWGHGVFVILQKNSIPICFKKDGNRVMLPDYLNEELDSPRFKV